MEDSEPELKRKVSELAKMITAASHVVVYTGAGLSTAAHIPDYRGPQVCCCRRARARAWPARAPCGGTDRCDRPPRGILAPADRGSRRA